MNLLIVIVFFLFINNFYIHAQVIKGNIIDAETGIGIRDAHVMLKGNAKGVISGKNGYFELSLSGESRNDSVIITHVVYKKMILPVDSVLNMGRSLVIPMSLHFHEFPEVVINAGKRKTKTLLMGKSTRFRNTERIFSCIGKPSSAFAIKFSSAYLPFSIEEINTVIDFGMRNEEGKIKIFICGTSPDGLPDTKKMYYSSETSLHYGLKSGFSSTNRVKIKPEAVPDLIYENDFHVIIDISDITIHREYMACPVTLLFTPDKENHNLPVLVGKYRVSTEEGISWQWKNKHPVSNTNLSFSPAINVKIRYFEDE